MLTLDFDCFVADISSEVKQKSKYNFNKKNFISNFVNIDE